MDRLYNVLQKCYITGVYIINIDITGANISTNQTFKNIFFFGVWCLCDRTVVGQKAKLEKNGINIQGFELGCREPQLHYMLAHCTWGYRYWHDQILS